MSPAQFETDEFAVPTQCRRYEGRVAVITGSAQGLGRVTAKRIAEEGGSVVIADIQGEKATATANALAEATGSDFLAVGADLTTTEGSERLAQEAMDRFGRIDTFVSCAAYQARLPFLEFPEEKMQMSVAVNVWALVRPLQAILPIMMNQHYGRVVTIGGTAFEWGAPWHSFLAGVGKGSVVGLTNTLAGEFGSHGITFNCVSPGGMESENDGTTDSAAGARGPELNPTKEQVERYLGGPQAPRPNNIGRPKAHPTEIAAAIAFLGSPESSFVTGNLVKLGGGVVKL